MRPIICLTERSRSGEAMRPRKYFCATMFVAVCDQKRGNSTSLCSNAGPSLPGISASRSSHSTSSNGSRPGMVKNRRGATFASPFDDRVHVFLRSLGQRSCLSGGAGRFLGGGHSLPPEPSMTSEPPVRRGSAPASGPGMLGGRSDDTDKQQENSEIPANCGNPPFTPVKGVYRREGVRRRPAAGRRRPCGRSSGAPGSRPSRRRGAARRGRPGRSAARARTRGRTCRRSRPPRSGRSCRSRSCSSRASSPSSASCPAWSASRRLGGRRRGLGRRRRAGRRLAARVLLALLRVRQRAADLLLRVRVVEHVGREDADRLAVARERVDLVDAPVVVPVVDHLLPATRRQRGPGRHEE